MQVVSKWIDGPDIARVQIDNDDFAEIAGCFVNVNAKDFGIELDKVVKIAPRSNAVLCDGEQTRNFVLNRLVGLFEVDSLNERLLDKTRQEGDAFSLTFSSMGARTAEIILSSRSTPRLAKWPHIWQRCWFARRRSGSTLITPEKTDHISIFAL